MPVQYESVLAEHRAVRSDAGWFDVTHLGRFELSGPGAGDALLRLLSNDIDPDLPRANPIHPDAQRRRGDHRRSGRLVVGPGSILGVSQRGQSQSGDGRIHRRARLRCARSRRPRPSSSRYRGPGTVGDRGAVRRGPEDGFDTASHPWESGEVRLAGTGYTGERGGEVCTDPETGMRLVERLDRCLLLPCGLASRDTLRLEAGLPLWGSDIDESTTPLKRARLRGSHGS